MDVEKLDNAIRQTENEVTQFRQKAEDMVDNFKQVTSAYLVEFANHEVKQGVTEKPDITEALGLENLSELKKQVREIISSYPSQVDGRFNNVSWAHKVDLSKQKLDSFGTHRSLCKQTSDSIENVIRELIGQIGSLLVKYGFADMSQYSVWELTTNHTVRYKYGLPDFETIYPNGAKLKSITRDYSKIIESYISAVMAYEKSQLDKKKTIAKDLWDKA
jgi:hypothetical protein